MTGMDLPASRAEERPALAAGIDPAIEAEIERRVAARCQSEAFRWRFRLVVAESVMLSVLVWAAGIALDKPTTLALQAALAVGVSCFASGLMLLGLTGLSAKAAKRFRAWRS